MLIRVVTLLLLLASALPVWADTTVVLSWFANTESDLAGYKLYQGTTSGQYGSPVDLGNVTSKTLVLPTPPVDQPYFWAITAYDKSGNESGKSAEASKLVKAPVVVPDVPRTITLALRGNPATDAWAIEANTDAVAPYSMEVWVNDALDHTENFAPFCSWGDNGAECTRAVRPAGTYKIELRAIKDAVEIARQVLTVVVPDATAPAPPQGLTAN